MNLEKLAEPFPLEDIEWRVSRSGIGQRGVFCMVLAYITARAVQQRLDAVCGPENWRLEEPRVLEINGKSAFACGLSISFNISEHDSTQEWITKWDVCEPTNIEPAKGGWSGAMKRAGAQWGIGRYLYYLDETFAEVSESEPIGAGRAWNYARLSEKHGGAVYWWKTPTLPAWALPKEPEHEISQSDLNELKRAWRDKFAADVKSPKDLREGFARFVTSVVGEFPSSDYTCWTRDALEKCERRIATTKDGNGISGDVPFEGAEQ